MGVVVGVLVGVVVGVVVGVLVGVAVLTAAQAGSVTVALLQGPEALAQLEPVPQKTWPPVQAALATVVQAPVVVLTQQPVACAASRCGESSDNAPTVAIVKMTERFPIRLNMMPSYTRRKLSSHAGTMAGGYVSKAKSSKGAALG